MDYIFSISFTCVAIASIWTIRDLCKKYFEILYTRDIHHHLICQNNRRNMHNEDNDNILQNISLLSMIEFSIQQEVIENCIDAYINSIDGELNTTKPPCLNIPMSVNIHEVPDEYKCPISKEIMKDPVISADGHTYEREMITRHMGNERRSPITLTDFLFPHLIPNWNIRKAIQSYIDNYSASSITTSREIVNVSPTTKSSHCSVSNNNV